jgi:hypothetical protein
VNELGLNWPILLDVLSRARVEPIQFHYMRVARPRGELAASFPNAWAPQMKPLLAEVLKENRRYQQIRNSRLLKQYALKKTKSGWDCSDELMLQTGGLSYVEMIGLARRADATNWRAQLCGDDWPRPSCRFPARALADERSNRRAVRASRRAITAVTETPRPFARVVRNARKVEAIVIISILTPRSL